jgi:hypothetical protein
MSRVNSIRRLRRTLLAAEKDNNVVERGTVR